MRRFQKFRRVAAMTLLVFAALNAASYFALSRHGTLLFYDQGADCIGFPWVIWQKCRPS